MLQNEGKYTPFVYFLDLKATLYRIKSRFDLFSLITIPLVLISLGIKKTSDSYEGLIRQISHVKKGKQIILKIYF